MSARVSCNMPRGRAFGAEGTCAVPWLRNRAISSPHQDVALPWMTDPRWEPDTLFLVFEEDFRFGPGHDMEPLPAEEAAAPLPGAYRPAESAGSAAAKAEAQSALARRLRAVGVRYEAPARAPRAMFADISRPLSDIVRYVTAAHRAGRGNVVWLSWQPGHAGHRAAHPSRILFGSTLLAVAKTGAATLRRAMDAGEVARGHFDLSLKHWLRRHPAAASACYMWPPMGNYAEHPSGCDPQRFAATRPACWAEPWCCPGTRRDEDPKRREKWLCAWTPKGAASWLRDVSNVPGNAEFDWRTWRTAAAAAAASAARPGEPTAVGAAAEGRGGGRAARRLRRPAGQGAAVFPDTEVTSESEPEAAQAQGEAPMSKRRKRLLRQARAYWRLRNWVDTQAEAAARPTAQHEYLHGMRPPGGMQLPSPRLQSILRSCLRRSMQPTTPRQWKCHRSNAQANSRDHSPSPGSSISAVKRTASRVSCGIDFKRNSNVPRPPHFSSPVMPLLCGLQADSVLEGLAPVLLEDTQTVEAWLSLGAPQPLPVRR